MSRVLILIGGITLMGILIGCGQDPAEEKPSPSPTASAPSAPSQAPRAHPVTRETRDTYQFYCAQCHGTEGHGNGINAPHLTVPPRDHTKADYLETRTDEHLFIAIQQGGRAHGEICLVTRQDGKLSVLYLDDGALLPLEPDTDVTYELLPIGSKVTLTPKE